MRNPGDNCAPFLREIAEKQNTKWYVYKYFPDGLDNCNIMFMDWNEKIVNEPEFKKWYVINRPENYELYKVYSNPPIDYEEDNNIDLSEILMCGDDTLYIISDNVIDALIRQGKLAELNKATCYLLLNYDKAIPDIKASYKDYYRIVQHKEVCCLERQFPNYTKWVSDILYVVCDTHAAFQYFCTRLNHCIHVSDIKDLPKVANDGVIIASGSEIAPVFLDLADKGAKMFLYDGFEELLLSKFDPSRLCDAAVDNTAFYHSIIENRNYCFKYTYMDCDDKLFYVDLIKGLPMCRKPTKDYKETCLELSTAMRRLLRDDIWSRYFQNISIASR